MPGSFQTTAKISRVGHAHPAPPVPAPMPSPLVTRICIESKHMRNRQTSTAAAAVSYKDHRETRHCIFSPEIEILRIADMLYTHITLLMHSSLRAGLEANGRKQNTNIEKVQSKCYTISLRLYA